MSGPLSTDFWNSRYSEEGFAYGEQPNAFLTAVADQIKPHGRVLLPGDGEGRNGVWLAQQGFDVTTVDVSDVGCKKALDLSAKHGVKIEAVCADLTTWQMPIASFDAVVSIFMHFMPLQRQALHTKMRDALKAEGLLIIEAFERANLVLRMQNPSVGGPDQLDMLFSEQILTADFAPLETRYLESLRTRLDEGHYHVGEAKVVRGIFQKS